MKALDRDFSSWDACWRRSVPRERGDELRNKIQDGLRIAGLCHLRNVLTTSCRNQRGTHIHAYEPLMSCTRRREGIEPGEPRMKRCPLVGRDNRNSGDASQNRRTRRLWWCSVQQLAVWQAWIEQARRSSLGYNRAVPLHTGDGTAGGIHRSHCMMSMQWMVEQLTFVSAVRAGVCRTFEARMRPSGLISLEQHAEYPVKV